MEQIDPRELQQLEELCIQDDAPFCEAACPLHVDVRTMLEAVIRGDFAAGAEVFRKKVPLPGVLSRISDQPCRAVCTRGEAGDPIEVGLLERSCAEYAGFPAGVPRLGSRKDQRVAVVGSGLSGLSAAIELAKRNYPVTVFEESGRPGGRLRTIAEERLPAEILEQELTILKTRGVEVRTTVRLCGNLTLSELMREYDAVYLATGCQQPPEGRAEPDATMLRRAWAEVDKTTLATPLSTRCFWAQRPSGRPPLLPLLPRGLRGGRLPGGDLHRPLSQAGVAHRQPRQRRAVRNSPLHQSRRDRAGACGLPGWLAPRLRSGRGDGGSLSLPPV